VAWVAWVMGEEALGREVRVVGAWEVAGAVVMAAAALEMVVGAWGVVA
jgi:hypothetical protein